MKFSDSVYAPILIVIAFVLTTLAVDLERVLEIRKLKREYECILKNTSEIDIDFDFAYENRKRLIRDLEKDIFFKPLWRPFL